MSSFFLQNIIYAKKENAARYIIDFKSLLTSPVRVKLKPRCSGQERIWWMDQYSALFVSGLTVCTVKSDPLAKESGK